MVRLPPFAIAWRTALVAALAFGGLAQAQSPSLLWGDNDPRIAADFPESVAICRRVRQALPPPADRPDAAARQTLKGCDSVDLYYGLGGQAKDVVRARQCAFIQAEQDENEDGPTGFGLLAMVYANGDGVPRNIDTAQRMACEEGFSQADIDARIKALEARRTAAGATRFDYCDDAMSDYSLGWCAAIDSDLEQQKRRKTFAGYADAWTPGQRKALAAVLKTETVYTDTLMRDETDMGGTMRFLRTWGGESKVRAFTDSLLKALVNNAGPGGDAATLARDDAALNAAWRRLAAIKLEQMDGIDHAGVTRTQRAWLKHRDAWTALARQRWPEKANAITAYVTRERTRRLQCLADGEGNADDCG